MSRKRKASKRKIKRSPLLGMFGLIVLIGASLAATVYLIFLRPGTMTQLVKPETPPQELSQTEKNPIKAEISLEVAEEVEVTELKVKVDEPIEETGEDIITEQADTKVSQELPVPPIETLSDPESRGPRVAIIIDDMGYRRKIAEKLIGLDLHLSFSFLPHSPHGQELAKKVSEMGKDVLLHLPMEATDRKWDPGPGALFLDMDKETTSRILAEDLAAVPLAMGINNHMGSRYSENSRAMEAFLAEIKPKNLFFFDSLTSSKSVGYKLAKQMAVKTGKRDIFLDNKKDVSTITKQLEKLVKIAEKYGQAIAIGHPYPATLEALTSSRPLLTEKVTIVALNKLLQ
jgi:polysaccharide deacetylase 2 family uncharacterized protein YibQ